MRRHLSRRTVLRGLGVSMALPFLDAMLPRGIVSAASAAAPGAAGVAGSAAAAHAPVRIAMFFTPNGMWMPNWTPKEVGTGFELPATLEPLKNVKNQLTVLTGLTLDGA